ncbi:hypothetical protein ACWDU8_18365 [Streptomyces sp. NPDC003388]
MYSKDGEKYFIVDAHIALWDARPENQLDSIGNLVGSCNDLRELMVLAAQGRVRLHTTPYPLDRFQDALADLDAGRVRGRAILVP